MKLAILAYPTFTVGYVRFWKWSAWLHDGVLERNKHGRMMLPSTGRHPVWVGDFNSWSAAFAQGCRALKVANMQFTVSRHGRVDIVRGGSDAGG